MPLGVGAVGGTATAAFTVNDSALFKAVVQVRIQRQAHFMWSPKRRSTSILTAEVGARRCRRATCQRRGQPSRQHTMRAARRSVRHRYSTQLAPPRPPGPAYQVMSRCPQMCSRSP